VLNHLQDHIQGLYMYMNTILGLHLSLQELIVAQAR
jgi:hypothetical protein